MKNSIKRIQNESQLSALLSARILRKAKAYQYIALAVLAFGLAACTQEDDFAPQDDLKDTPITIASAGVAELTTRSAETTPLVGTTDEPATMSVFVTSNSTETKYKATNLKWNHDGSGWNSETVVFFEGASSSQKIYACSPFFYGSTGSITVTASEQTDWLVATATDLTSNTVDLKMTHALAKLTIVLTVSSSEYPGYYDVVDIFVQNMYASGTLDIAENSWSTPSNADATIRVPADNNETEVLVIPMEQCTSFPVAVQMYDERVFVANVSLEKVGNKLEGGKAYTINLQVGYNTATVTGVMIHELSGWIIENELY